MFLQSLPDALFSGAILIFSSPGKAPSFCPCGNNLISEINGSSSLHWTITQEDLKKVTWSSKL